MLTEENFEIVTNSDGYEMIILPESEEENESSEEDFCNEHDVLDTGENFLSTNCPSVLVDHENWDIEWSNQSTPLIDNLSNDILQSKNKFLEQTSIPYTDTIVPILVNEDDNYCNLKLKHDNKELVESCDITHDSKLIKKLSMDTEIALLARNGSNIDNTHSYKTKREESNKNVRPENDKKSESLSIYDQSNNATSENLSVDLLNAKTEILEQKTVSGIKNSQPANIKEDYNIPRPENLIKKLLGSHDKSDSSEFTESLTVAFIKAETAFLEKINMTNTTKTKTRKSKENFKPTPKNTLTDPLSVERKESHSNVRSENDSKKIPTSCNIPDCTKFTGNLTVDFINAETEFLEQIDIKNASKAQSAKSKENNIKTTPENDSEELLSRCDKPVNNDLNLSLDHQKRLSDSNNHSGSDMSLEDTQIENVIVDDSCTFNCVSNKLPSDLLGPDSPYKMFSPEEKNKTNEMLECSVYETPFHDWLRSSSKSELYNPSAHSLYHGDCKRELRFESSSGINENQPTVGSMVESPLCSTSVVSSLELSYYATPCSNEIHNTRVSRSISVQDLNGSYNSPLSVLEGGILEENKKDKMSKSMDGFRSQESCDIHDTCSNTSKVLDSGYPDSFSERIMDSDSIKFDDVETESEGENPDSALPSPVEPIDPPLHQRVVQNVENGDLANNNRDGEGNNMVADMEEDFFEFEAQIEEDIVPNEAAALCQDCSDNLNQHDNQKHDSSFCNASEYNSQDYSPPLKSSQNETLKISDPLKDCSNSVKLNYRDKNETTDKKSIKSSQSDTSISTISSWSCMKSSESTSRGEPEIRQGDHSKIGRDNSLTTVLEGCSRFSDCSLVRPIEVSSSPNNEEELVSNVFPKWMLSIDSSVCESEAKRTNQSHHRFKLVHANPSQDRLSSPSFYHSLNSSPVESDSEDENSDFPKWLLDVQVSDAEDSNIVSNLSNITVFNSDFSMVGNDTDEFDFDVQVDARGGGDPQRDEWYN